MLSESNENIKKKIKNYGDKKRHKPQPEVVI